MSKLIIGDKLLHDFTSQPYFVFPVVILVLVFNPNLDCNILTRISLGPKYFWVQNIFGSKIFLGSKYLWVKKYPLKFIKISCEKICNETFLPPPAVPQSSFFFEPLWHFVDTQHNPSLEVSKHPHLLRSI